MKLKKLSQGVLLRLALLGFFSYWIIWFGIDALVGHFEITRVTTFDVMMELSSGLVLGIAPVVGYGWSKTIYRSFKEGSGEGYDLLSFSIFVLMAGLIYQRVWSNLLRWLERPEWMLTSPLAPLAPWTIFFGIVFLLLAPGTTENNIPNKNILLLMAAVAVGSAISAGTVGYFIGQALPSPGNF